MNINMGNVGRRLAAAGVACLLLGALARTPGSVAVTAVATATQSIVISDSTAQHWSYGQFDMTQNDWLTANSRDNWGDGTVPYSLVASRWMACILHSFEEGHFVEVLWIWDSEF